MSESKFERHQWQQLDEINDKTLKTSLLYADYRVKASENDTLLVGG